MKRDIVYIHLPSKGKAPKLEAASQTVCRWGSWMGWIDNSRLEARTPSPLLPLAFISQSCPMGEDGEGRVLTEAGAVSPTPQSFSIVVPLKKGQLLCLAPLQCWLSCALACVCLDVNQGVHFIVFQQGVKELGWCFFLSLPSSVWVSGLPVLKNCFTHCSSVLFYCCHFCFVCFQQLSVFQNSLCSSCMREFMVHLNMNVVQFL